MVKEMMMVPTTDYNNLVNYYKGRLTESALLNKAGRLAAERHVTLTNPHVPDSLALAMSKPREREIHKLTKQLRTGGVSGASRAGTIDDDDDDGDDDDLLKTPLESKLDKILRNTRKRRRAKDGNVGHVVESVKKIKKTPKKQQQPSKVVGPSKIPTLIGVQKQSFKKTKTSGGWKKALKRGALKGLGKQWGVSWSDGDASKTSSASATTTKTFPKRKTTPRAVKALRPAPGWEDFTDGYKSKRYPLTDDYAGSSEATEQYKGETDEEEEE